MVEKDELDEALDIDYPGDVKYRLRQDGRFSRLEVVVWQHPNVKNDNTVEFAHAILAPGIVHLERFGCIGDAEELVTIARMALLAAEQLARLNAGSANSNEG